jgi:hypothetical protein
MAEQQPQWQSITMLPTLGPHIDGMLETAQENQANLEEARPKPHVLGNYTIERVISVYTIQRDDLGLFDEQLRRWAALDSPTAAS